MQKVFSENTKMADMVLGNPQLLLMFPRFGMDLGFGDHMEEKLAAYNPDILIINPLLIAYDTNEHFLKICRDFSNVIPVALVTSYVDAGILKQFKDVIEINDSKQKVVTKIFNLLSDNKLTQDKPESIELSNRETDVLVALVKGLTNKKALTH